MEEFVQEFKRGARESRYEGHPLMEEFKQDMDGVIRWKLMEAEYQPSSIKQQFKRAIALDRNWRESKREEERLRGRKENNGTPASKSNNGEIQRQIVLQPQVQQKRQKMPSQQAIIEPALMERVERMNMVIGRP